MRIKRREQLELSIIMPCLNEEKSVRFCIREAQEFFKKHRIRGEILIVDNGSIDNSVQEAKRTGARVVVEKRRGYGRALRRGIYESSGKYLILGDCDTTYDFQNLELMVEALRAGNDMVIGDRFAGGIEKGAMSFSHKLGVRALSFLGRCRYHVKVRDFHSGLRGISREAALLLCLRTAGMEFATEMIAEGARKGCVIAQVPVRLRNSRVERISHLRTLEDGVRHVWYMVKNRC